MKIKQAIFVITFLCRHETLCYISGWACLLLFQVHLTMATSHKQADKHTLPHSTHIIQTVPLVSLFYLKHPASSQHFVQRWPAQTQQCRYSHTGMTVRCFQID